MIMTSFVFSWDIVHSSLLFFSFFLFSSFASFFLIPLPPPSQLRYSCIIFIQIPNTDENVSVLSTQIHITTFHFFKNLYTFSWTYIAMALQYCRLSLAAYCNLPFMRRITCHVISLNKVKKRQFDFLLKEYAATELLQLISWKWKRQCGL